jgi:hypothetical protein
MPVAFYGKWSLEVVANANKFEERARIIGQDMIGNERGVLASTVDGKVGTKVVSTGLEDALAPWYVFMERSGDGGLTWQTNLIQRIPSVTPQDGLIVTLYADDSVVAPQDSNFIVKFKYLNKQVNPPGPSTPPFGFTLPPSSFRPPGPPRARTKVAVVSRLEIHGKTPF